MKRSASCLTLLFFLYLIAGNNYFKTSIESIKPSSLLKLAGKRYIAHADFVKCET